jgi:hypothetical protein
MRTRKNAVAAMVLGLAAMFLVPLPSSSNAWAVASVGPVVSRAGVSWSAEDASSGDAVLTYGHDGCTDVDADGFCTGGSWSTIPGAHWIWRAVTVTPEEEASGTPWVTFTDTFSVPAPKASTKLRISADDYYTVKVNGGVVGERLTDGLGVETYTFTPTEGLNTLEVRVRSSAGPAGLAYRLDTTLPTSLTLKAADRRLTFGQATELTASLTGGTPQSQVRIYAKPVGGKKYLVTRGEVGADGILTVRDRPRANAVYTATYAGETGWKASTSSPVQVSVAARWTARSIGGYKTQGQYRLYHWTAACRAPTYRGCPTERFALAPEHAGVKVRVTFQVWNGSDWRTYGRYLWKLDKHSVIRCFTWYETRQIIGGKFRVSATFMGDPSHGRSTSDWVYWKVTR